MYARQHAVEHPDQAAIVMATSGETVTYGQYEARCNQVAHLLRAAGLQRGDHISVFMENNARMLEIEGGAERTGLYFTLINRYLALDEVAYIVTNSRSRLLFSSAGMRSVAEAAAAQCPQLERCSSPVPMRRPLAGIPTTPRLRDAKPSRCLMSPSAPPCSTRRARPVSPRGSCGRFRRQRPASPSP